MPILETTDLAKKYAGNSKYALDKVSLSIEKGEIIALLGESGSGKTTLLRLIAGFEEANHGTLVVNGQTFIDSQTFKAPEKRNLGMVFQDYALFPHMTVGKNIAYGISKSQAHETVDKMLQLVGMEQFKNRYPHQLSGGQQQRVALARALATAPHVLLLDEPFSNLDEALKEQVRNDLKEILKQSAITAIFVTHDTRDALAVADRIAILKDGELQQFGTAIELFEHPKNQYVAQYFGKVNWLGSNQAIQRLQEILPTDTSQYSATQLIGIRPSNLELFKEQLPNSASVQIVSTTYCGHYQEVKVRFEDTLVTVNANLQHTWKKDTSAYLKIDDTKLIVLEREK